MSAPTSPNKNHAPDLAVIAASLTHIASMVNKVMEQEGSQNPEEGDITMMLLPSPPMMKNHFHLEMISQPSFSTIKYKRFLHEQGIAINDAKDDLILVVCPGKVGGNVTTTFEMMRSSLQRSTPLDFFFNSKSYRFGCGMTLYFTELPEASFAIIKEYLDKGPDRYFLAHMTECISKNYVNDGVQLEIYIRLYKSACQLELFGLQEMAWKAIEGKEDCFIPQFCVTIATIIFAEKTTFNSSIKKWLMKHIKTHFVELYADPIVRDEPEETWSQQVRKLDKGFRKEWKAMVKAHRSSLSLIEEADEEEEKIVRILKSMDDAELARAERAMHTVKEEKQATPPKAVSNEMETPVTDDDEDGLWEDLDYYFPPDNSAASNDKKARTVLGAPIVQRNSNSSEMTPRLSSLDADTHKARAVMGLNTNNGGFIAGRRKQPTLTRAARSFSKLLG